VPTTVILGPDTIGCSTCAFGEFYYIGFSFYAEVLMWL